MTQPHHPIEKSYGQHRMKPGDLELARCVAGLWQRLHPGVPPTPIEDLGNRPHVPCHALKPQRVRVYL